MMLYKSDGDYADVYMLQHGEEATLADIKAALAEHGLVAVPAEPTIRMNEKGAAGILECAFSEVDCKMGMYACEEAERAYKAMIKAAQEPIK